MSSQLHTTSAAIRAHGAEAGSIHEGKKPRYHLRAGLEYLHWSGSKLTSRRDHAWTGTIDQAKACRRTFSAAAGCKAWVVGPLPVHSEEADA